ncbi:MAG: dihydropteroate synthase [Candidatus Berkiellales bacterium]
MFSSPKIMGILNVTPDSFFDGGRYFSLEKALSQAQQMIDQGADVIDVGGESTRPGATPVSVDQECARVIPIIEHLSKGPIPISIDTMHAEVMKAALSAGASMVNDVNGFQEKGALETVAAFKAKVCIMHMQNEPQTMQAHPTYRNIIQEIITFFESRLAACEKAGILKENIYLDPGFGFGKNLAHNLTLLGQLSTFKKLGCPLLVGLSRKSMFGQILNVPVEERLSGSIAAAVLAMLQGADMIRTHDVAETKKAVQVVQAVQPYWQ